MLSTTNGQTPSLEVRPYARARMPGKDDDGDEVVADWRPPDLPYVTPPEDRLPLEYNHGGCPAKGPGPVEDTCRAMEQLIINGTSVRAARAMVGPHKQRWIEWEKHAAADKYPFDVFMRRIERARAHVEATCNTVIRSTAIHPNPDVAFRGATKTLEHHFRDEYVPQKAAPTVQNTTNVQVNVQSLNALGSLDLSKLELLASALGVRPLSEPIAPTRALVEPDEDE